MFTGYAVARGAELATIEAENFGIDHAKVGALWIETIGFPQAVADTIRNVASRCSATAGPLDLSLRSACTLAEAVARKDDAAIAWAALPPAVQARYGGGRRASPMPRSTSSTKRCRKPSRRSDGDGPPACRRRGKRVRDALR